MSHRLEVECVTPGAAFEQLAEIALAAGNLAEGVVSGVGILAVPDVMLVEFHASGRSLPDAPTLRRRDGREVAFYRLPERVIQ